MQKTYFRIVWENYPSTKSPLNEYNLNKIDAAADAMDNRIISLDASKFDKSEAQLLVKYIEYDEDTGIFKITHYNGASYEIDTLLEKLAINFDYDYQTQRLIIELSDGTVKYVDLSALITQYEFLDSDTVAFSVDNDGKVTAIVKEGSIQEKHLRPDYLADIILEQEKAKSSAISAAESAIKSKSYAIGGTGTREGEDKDNAKEYARQAKESAEKATEIAGGQFIPISEKGAIDGVATLDSNGKVPAEQLPEDIFADITPEDIGAVKKTGDIMTGSLSIESGAPTLQVYNNEMGVAQSFRIESDGTRGIWDGTGKWVVETVTAGTSGVSSFHGNADSATKLGTSTVGSSTKPIYLNSGTPTESSSTVGNANTPVYLNAGKITSTGKSFANYLPLKGGTMSGALNLGNGVWNKVGDDAYLGDMNRAGCVCIKSQSASSNTGICFLNNAENTSSSLSFVNGNQLFADQHFGVGNTIWCDTYASRTSSGTSINLGGDAVIKCAQSIKLQNYQTMVRDYNDTAWAPIYASGFGQNSSRRVKENIEEMSGEEARKILLLAPVTYDYKNKKNGTECRGLIAEDVAPIIPSCVIGDVNCADDDKKAIETIGIDYSKLVPYLIKMVQIQQEEIEKLKQ